MKFLVFLIGFVVALLLVRYRAAIWNFTGEIDFAQKYLGGTVNLILLLALATFVLSLMYALGTFQSIFGATFGRFF